MKVHVQPSGQVGGQAVGIELLAFREPVTGILGVLRER
jgi:hypothetical protein